MSAVPGLLSRLEGDDFRLAGLMVVAKVVILGYGILAFFLMMGHGPANGLHGFLEIWDRWDAPHYVDLALLGYRAVDPGMAVIDGYRRAFPGDLPLYIVFFPLFPWLVGAVTTVLRDPIVSAFVVSGIASLFVAPLLYRLVRIEYGREVGLTAAWFLIIFPTAYFLHIGYTESLFLALVLGSFLAARLNRWWLAGILGGLAALTRINGLVLIPALLAEALVAWDEDPEHRFRWEWAAIGLVAVGFAGYLALNLRVYGDPLVFLQIQHHHWSKALAPPWDGIKGVVGWITGQQSAIDAFKYGWMELTFIGLGAAGTIAAAFLARPSWFVWMAGNWLLFTGTSFVLSVPRYSLTLFPLFALLALASRWPVLGFVLALLSVAVLGAFTAQFAIGQWAF